MSNATKRTVDKTPKATKAPKVDVLRTVSEPIQTPSIATLASRIDSSSTPAPDFAATVIREAIVIGTIKGGQSLKQDDLASILSMSKMPIREALRELQAEGLVEFSPNKGFVASRQSLHEMLEVFELRLALEPLAIKLSMPMITQVALKKALQAIEQMETLTDTSWLCKINLDFHFSLYAPASAEHLMKMMRHAHYVSHRYLHLKMQTNTESLLSQAEHRAILAAFEKRDIERAQTLTIKHIADTYTSLSAALADRLPE